jgi:hypothetical protein
MENVQEYLESICGGRKLMKRDATIFALESHPELHDNPELYAEMANYVPSLCCVYYH